MSRTPESTSADLGGRVGVLLRERGNAVVAPTIQMENVVAGAGRRRRRSRIAASTLCVALVVGGAYLVTQRVPQPEPAQQQAVTDRPVLESYAVLDGFEPQAVYASAGGAGYGPEFPQIDVWAMNSQRLVIRTVTESEGQVETLTTEVVATTTAQMSDDGPWSYRNVDRVLVRGVNGAIEQLASDQYSVWVPTGVSGRYTQVIARGMSSEATLSAVESMAEVGGVLQPIDSFVLMEHADALPTAGPSSPFARLDYGNDGGGDGPWVAAYEPEQGRASLELAMWSVTGRMETIDGREVLLTDEQGQSWASWIGGNGLVVGVGQALPHVEELIPSVRMVSEPEFLELAAQVSDRILANTTASDSVSLGATSVTRRTGADGDALCLAAFGETACVREPQGDETQISNMHTEIDGHWLMFGFREIGDQDPATIRPGELRFVSPEGVPCVVHVTESDGGYWYVVEVPDGVNVVTTNVGDIFGGPVGDITRPQVASVY